MDKQLFHVELLYETERLLNELTSRPPLRAQRVRFAREWKAGADQNAPGSPRLRAASKVMMSLSAELYAWSGKDAPHTKEYSELVRFAARVCEMEADRLDGERPNHDR